ncbi:DUF262 domain-containing protein [Micromonospora lupini]|uniref:DUF262 domain-containing protein n=1 Tax=Micromonospora lupini TaxID=285679 RepID=UPI0022537C09|nr:DUF262 domain-containing protein [Micromonospora lupini]MCX5068753.1 DUF262 domain-containing protein [Micromonospora lupini]
MTITSLEFAEQVASAPSNITVNSFHKTFSNGDLVLRPPFQRNLVWNLEQQSFLVDSILRGLPVPEIYIQRETSADGDEKTVIVDGQQRLTTCIRFLDDELRLTNDDDLDSRWRGRKFGELTDDLKRRFRSFELIVRKLPSLEESVLREVFRRLNKTVEPLEAQELRHAAFTGPFVQLVEAAAAQNVLTEVGVFSAKDYLRRRNDEFIAEVAYAVTSRAYPNKKDGLDELFLTFEKQGTPQGTLEELERRFGRVFLELSSVAGPLRRTRFRNKSDFYSLFVLLAKQAELLPLNNSAHGALIVALKKFSDLVNDIKREEAEGRSIDPLVSDELGTEAVRYLRAVERAASDRLNRVRREEALRFALAPVLAVGHPTPLSSADAAWRSASPVDEQEDPSDPNEKVHVQEMLLRDATSS